MSKKARKSKAQLRAQQWYEKNKKRIKRRRNKQYHTDPTFREAAIQRALRSKWTKKQDIVLKEIKKFVAPSIVVGDHIFVLYTLHDVAQLFSKHPDTIRRWLRNDVLPPMRHVEQAGIGYDEQEFHLLRSAGMYLAYPKRSMRESVFSKQAWGSIMSYRARPAVDRQSESITVGASHEIEGQGETVQASGTRPEPRHARAGEGVTHRTG